MVKKGKTQSTYDMESDTPAQEAAPVQADAAGEMDLEPAGQQVLAAEHQHLKPKPRKRGQGTTTQKRRKQLKLDKALGIADKKSTKAIRLSTAKQRKQHAKGLWSKAD